MNVPPQTIDIIKNVFVLALVLLVALTLATRFGLIYCGQIPYWCDAYRTIMRVVLNRNYPAVLIAYGESGMGDYNTLYNYIRRNCHIYVRTTPIARLGPGNLEKFDVVIVERAKVLDHEQLEMLWDFVAGGGKLVFVGNAGTDDGKNGTTFYVENNVANPWDRVKPDGTVISFGSDLLGLRYVGDVNGYSGPLYVEDDPLSAAIPQGISYTGPYARVDVLGSSVFGKQVVVLSAGKDPLLVRIGYRILYLAFPPERALGQGDIRLAFLLRNLCQWMGA